MGKMGRRSLLKYTGVAFLLACGVPAQPTPPASSTKKLRIEGEVKEALVVKPTAVLAVSVPTVIVKSERQLVIERGFEFLRSAQDSEGVIAGVKETRTAFGLFVKAGMDPAKVVRKEGDKSLADAFVDIAVLKFEDPQDRASVIVNGHPYINLAAFQGDVIKLVGNPEIYNLAIGLLALQRFGAKQDGPNVVAFRDGIERLRKKDGNWGRPNSAESEADITALVKLASGQGDLGKFAKEDGSYQAPVMEHATSLSTTALCVLAEGRLGSKTEEFILSQQKSTGAFEGGKSTVYTTILALQALHV